MSTYKVHGMHCASCAAIIEKTLYKQDGVKSASVSYGSETTQIEYDKEKTTLEDLSLTLDKYGYSLTEISTQNEGSKKENPELAALRRNTLISIPLVFVAIVAMAWEILGTHLKYISPFPSEYMLPMRVMMFVAATYMLFFVGRRHLVGIARFVRYRVANMDTLVGLGTSAAYFYSITIMFFAIPLSKYFDTSVVYFDATIIVIGLITLGSYLEMRAKSHTSDTLKKLIGLQEKTACIVRSGAEQTVPVGTVVVGDTVVVKPGMRLPVDGTVLGGSSNIDESMLTGEPLPVFRDAGSDVSAGTVNTTGSFTMQATSVGADTLLAHIVQLVSDAQG